MGSLTDLLQAGAAPVHADEIRRRFASTNVTTGQIILFGLSGGLIPCSAVIALLVLCLQVNQLLLGIAVGFMSAGRAGSAFPLPSSAQVSQNQ